MPEIRKVILAALLSLGAIVTGCTKESTDETSNEVAVAPGQLAQNGTPAFRSAPVSPYVSRTPLAQLPVASLTGNDSLPLRQGGPTLPAPRASHGPDPLAQAAQQDSGLAVTPTEFAVANPNFQGMSPGGNPPDANGAPGPNHYIQTVNQGRAFQIWNKQGVSLAGPTNMQQIWIDAGAPANDDCRTRMRGDPYVVYDHLADRWVLTQFANRTTNTGDPLQVQCIAVSRGPDPVNDGWYAYTFILGFSNDYPKLAVWPDGYYMISQRGYFGNPIDVTVFDRATMLNGAAASFQTMIGDPSLTVIMLPSELEGPPPAAGTPNFYVRPIDGALFGGADRIEINEFHVDWGNTANTTFGNTVTLTPADFSSDICAGANLFNNCIDQPGAFPQKEALSVWPMAPLHYRNFGTHESLVFNHTVDVDGNGLAGVRWYELRRSGGGAWTLYQQGTYSPPDGTSTHRWMGSIAMDKAGNMALGYSVSNATNVFPGIRYTGRLATDPLGVMAFGENTLAAGAISTNGTRWGDYSAMRVDPADGCTFWYTTEFNAAGGQETRIGAFRFPTCNPADLSITKTDSPDPVVAGGTLQYTLEVKNNGPSTAHNVVVTDTLPAGTVFLASSSPCVGGAVKTCALGALLSGATKLLTIQVQVPANLLSSIPATTTNITNTAQVAATELDPDTSNNTATESTQVIEQADVKITKICKPDGPAQAGATGFCDITVTNLGVSDAQNVVVTDTLTSNSPFQITSYGVTPPVVCAPAAPSGFATTHNVTCTVGTLAAGQSTTIRISVTTQQGADVNDLATVSSSTFDPVTANNQATGTVTFVAQANLSIDKTAAPKPVAAGTNLTYTLIASNAGPSSAVNVVVTDTLPASVSLVSATPSAGSCSGGIPGNPAQPLICTLGTLNSGGNATITVIVNVSPSTPDGTILVNNGAISSDTADSDNTDNVVTATVPVVAQADLAITNVVDNVHYQGSAKRTFTITVTNNGPSDAQAVKVTDTLPNIPQLIYLSDTGSCTKINNILTCNMGTMPVGTSKSFNIKIKVNGNHGTLTNTATVTSSTTDPNAANNTASQNIIP